LSIEETYKLFCGIPTTLWIGACCLCFRAYAL